MADQLSDIIQAENTPASTKNVLAAINKPASSTAAPKRSFRSTTTSSSSKQLATPTTTSSSSSSGSMKRKETEEEKAAAVDEEEKAAIDEEDAEQDEEEEEEEEDEAMEDLRNKFRDALRLLRTSQEECERLDTNLEDQKRFFALMQKTHNKEMAVKDGEIAALKRKLTQTKDESDKFRVDSQKDKDKRESTHKAEVEQLRAELRTATTAGNGGNNGASSKSFSMRSFSSMFQSGKSQRMQQQKMHANADVAERDQARMLAGLKSDLDKAKHQLKRLHVEAEEYSDCSAQSAMEIKRLTEHCDLVESKLREGKAKFKKMQIAVQDKKQALSDMTLKAGWVAEQLQQTTEELQYERSKHIKQSRLQQVKQVEELHRVKQELAELKRTVASNGQPKPSASSSSSSSSKKQEAAEARLVAAAVTAPVQEEVVILGTETIAELVALKAKQREQRDVKTDHELKKNKDQARRDRQQQAANGQGDAIGQMLERLRGCGEEEDDEDEAGHSDEEWF